MSKKFEQIFNLADSIFKEKSQTINIIKGTFLNMKCLQFIENIIFRNFNFLGKKLYVLTFP